MTEYDYSPEAYERFMATQNRIANWVDKTEQHRPEFKDALNYGPEASSRPSPASYDSHSRLKRSPPPSPPHHQHYGHSQPRHLFIHPPPPESESSEGYGEGPGPMPLPSPGMMFAPQHQQPFFHPMAQPMMSPPPMMMPPTYMTSPHRSSHRHRSSHSHSRSRSHQPSPAYYSMVSPPLSPGYQYGYPPVMSGGHPGYAMMPQHRSQFPVMSDLPPPPLSAPANVSTFSVPSVQAGGYFQPHSSASPPTAQLQPSSGFLTPTSIPYSPQPGLPSWSIYGAASPAHSVMSPGSVGSGSPPQSPYAIPQYQGIHSAMASPTYFAAQTQQAPTQTPYLVPQGLHQRVYDLSNNKHHLRRSVG